MKRPIRVTWGPPPPTRDRPATGALFVAGVVLAALTETIASTVLLGDIIGDTHATPDEFAWLDIGYSALKLIGDSARRHRQSASKAVWSKRALKMDTAIQTALRDKMPIRVVVCDGEMRDRNDPEAKASRVQRRLLDPVPWTVTFYNQKTGKCKLTRGVSLDPFVDQFSLDNAPPSAPDKRRVSGFAFVRDPEIRRKVRVRANGTCELCGQPGFPMADGRVYVETHHVTALAAGGFDTEDNVIALCPNHHREAHHGANKQEMKRTLMKRICSVTPKGTISYA